MALIQMDIMREISNAFLMVLMAIKYQISLYWLDNAPLVNKFRINRREFDHPFTISSQALSNGKHSIRVEAVNGTYRRNKVIEERAFYVDNNPLQAAFVRPDTQLKVFQGKTLHVQFQVNKNIKTAQIKTLAKIFDAFPESSQSSIYEDIFPFLMMKHLTNICSR